MRATLLAVLLTVLVLWLLLAAASFVFQEKLLFIPRTLDADHRFNFPGRFEEVTYRTEADVDIHALHFRVDSPKGLVVYFHGNAGSLASWGDVARDFTRLSYDVLIMDFRGYGKSTGRITREAQLHHDAKFVYEEATKQYAEDEIVLYGRSLGTGIASKIAAEHTPRLLLLETPYYNLASLAGHHYGFLPTGLLVRYKLENDVYVPRAKCPVVLFHGTHDELIPHDQAVELAELSDNVQLRTIDGAGHNNLGEFAQYHQQLAEALESTR